MMQMSACQYILRAIQRVPLANALIPKKDIVESVISSEGERTDENVPGAHIGGLRTYAEVSRRVEGESESTLLPLRNIPGTCGKCRPCSFYHSAVGCQRGTQCLFCHSCDAEELERWRLEKQQKRNAKRNHLRKCRASKTALSPNTMGVADDSAKLKI